MAHEPNWPNPYSPNLIYVPVTDLAHMLAADMPFSNVRTIDGTSVPYDAAERLKFWTQRTPLEKLDGYILDPPHHLRLESNIRISVGVRYGPFPEDYYSPHVPTYLVPLLIAYYRSRLTLEDFRRRSPFDKAG